MGGGVWILVVEYSGGDERGPWVMYRLMWEVHECM